MASRSKTVYVGMSGGVDSSVTALLLKQQGFNVVGAFIETWQPDFLECSSQDDARDAMRVCAQLDIPFVTVDCKAQYKENVVDYMIGEYREGRTPNPDVMCNTFVKFGLFFEEALRQGADLVATGHYARVVDHNGTLCLRRGVDQGKDQSYFLWNIEPSRLSSVLFPVGGYEKREIRRIATEHGIPTADKKDSQGVCFMGKLDMKEFLSHYITPRGGAVLNDIGEVIGEHTGAWFYTIGQRHGFEVMKKKPDSGPYYVTGKDVDQNTLTVSESPAENREGVVSLASTNWFVTPEVGSQYLFQFRYRAQPIPGTITACESSTATVELTGSSFGVTPGQSMVVYDGDMCLGGGVIEHV